MTTVDAKKYKLNLKKYKIDADNNIVEKHCVRCDSFKELKFWGKNKVTKDGMQSWCKKCQNAAAEASHAKKKKREEEQKQFEKDVAGLLPEEKKKSEKAVETAMKTKKKNLNNHSSWNTSDIEIPERVLRQIEPLWKYMKNLVVLNDGTIAMKQGVVEIVDFFGLDARKGIDLIYSFIRRDEKGKYRFARKLGGPELMAKVYDESLRHKKRPEEEEMAFLAERFYVVEEELKQLKELVKNLVEELT